MSPIQKVDRSSKRWCSYSLDQTSSTKKPQQYDHDHPDHWIPSERFWDTLPKVYLTHRALIEHDRRNYLQDLALQKPTKIQRRRSERLRKSPRGKQFLLLYAIDNTKPSLELQRFARHGGPDLTTIRGFPDPTMSNRIGRRSRRIITLGRTISTRPTGPYDKNYELKLAQAGIFTTRERDENNEVVLPTNYDELTKRLNRARESLSPSRFTEKDFQKFLDVTEHEVLEGGIMSKSVAVIEGSRGPIDTLIGGSFNNMKKFDPDLAVAIPDSYDGISPLSINQSVLDDLNDHIVPNTDQLRPALPNFFLEAKSKQGRADVGKRQAAHVGAIGARGMMSVQSHPSLIPIYDNHAYSLTSTYHNGQLMIYASHAAAPKTTTDRPQYYMTPLNGFSMIGNSETFRRGATYYRNARDLAKEQRDSVIQDVNQRVHQMSESNDNRASTTPLMRTTSQGVEDEHPSGSDPSTDLWASKKGCKRSRNATSDDDYDDGHDRKMRRMT